MTGNRGGINNVLKHFNERCWQWICSLWVAIHFTDLVFAFGSKQIESRMDEKLDQILWSFSQDKARLPSTKSLLTWKWDESWTDNFLRFERNLMLHVPCFMDIHHSLSWKSLKILWFPTISQFSTNKISVAVLWISSYWSVSGTCDMVWETIRKSCVAGEASLHSAVVKETISLVKVIMEKGDDVKNPPATK